MGTCRGQNKCGGLQTSTAANKPTEYCCKKNLLSSPPGKWHVFTHTHTQGPAGIKWSVWHHKDNVLFHSQQRAHTNSCRISAFKANLAVHSVKLILTLFSISMALSIFKSQRNTAHCATAGVRQAGSAVDSTEHCLVYAVAPDWKHSMWAPAQHFKCKSNCHLFDGWIILKFYVSGMSI